MTVRAFFRPDLEGLRAVAVLLVLLYHARVPGVRGGYVAWTCSSSCRGS